MTIRFEKDNKEGANVRNKQTRNPRDPMDMHERFVRARVQLFGSINEEQTEDVVCILIFYIDIIHTGTALPVPANMFGHTAG